jgi:hypothetical protein
VDVRVWSFIASSVQVRVCLCEYFAFVHVYTFLTCEYTHHKKWFGASHLKKRHPPTHLPPYEYEFFQ